MWGKFNFPFFHLQKNNYKTYIYIRIIIITPLNILVN